MHNYFLARFKNIFWLVIPIPFAIISISITGFEFGVSNNVFHIPYVLRLNECKEFAQDQFYQSLKYFTSVVWPLLRLISNEKNIYEVFFFSNLISRIMAFLTIWYLIKNNGIRSNTETILCLGFLSINPLMIGTSRIGGHGLFINYFTHTELTWPFVLAAIVSLQKNMIIRVGAIVGSCFSINAFVGLWLFFITFFAKIYDKHKYTIKLYCMACLAFCLFAMPVIIWIGFAFKDIRASEPFSYIEYIRAYYPGHFLIEAAKLNSIIRLLLIYLCGLFSSCFLEQRRFWIGVQLGCLFLFALGAILPYFFDSRLIFNLHLLRSDGIEQMIAAILSGVVGTKLACRESHLLTKMLGILILCFMAFPYPSHLELVFVNFSLILGLIIDKKNYFSLENKIIKIFIEKVLNSKSIPFLLLGSWFIFKFSLQKTGISLWATFIFSLFLLLASLSTKKIRHSAILVVIVLLLSASATSKINNRIVNSEKINEDKMRWVEFTKLVRNSDIHGPIIVPPKSQKGNLQIEENELFEAQNYFQLFSRKSVWVDWKQGAAVMWYPSFFKQWMARYSELSLARNAEDLRNLAIKNKIEKFITIDNTGCPKFSKTVISSGRYSLCLNDP
jgi:hypothetical protein